jgi:hypothetical protein
MDCADVRAALVRGEVPPGPAAAAHLSTCPACVMLVESPGLVRALDREARDPEPHVDALLAKTLAAVADERGPAAKMRELATPWRIVLALAVAVVMPLLVLLVTPRPDLDVVPRGRFALDVFLYALPAVAALVVALWPMQRTVSMHTRGLVALCGVLAAACVAALPPIHGSHPASLIAEGEFGRRAIGCLLFGTFTALPAFVVMRMVAREGSRVGVKAFVLGLAAALSGSAAVFLHCPITHPGHLWAGHFTVLLPAAIWALVHGRGRL